MALYDKHELVKMAEEAIKRNNLFFVNKCGAGQNLPNLTFIGLYTEGSDELDYLKRLLNENKIRTKSAIRSKLFKSDKAGELLALYRLICTPDERRMLNQQYIEMNTNDKGLTVNFIDKSKDDDK